MQTWKRFVRWLIFSVVLSLVPLGVSALIRATRGQAVTLESLLANGELLLIAAALTSAAVGDLLGGTGKRPVRELIAGGSCIVLLAVSALYFADVSAARASQSTIDLGLVRSISIVLFSCALLSSGSCVLLSED